MTSARTGAVTSRRAKRESSGLPRMRGKVMVGILPLVVRDLQGQPVQVLEVDGVREVVVDRPAERNAEPLQTPLRALEPLRARQEGHAQVSIRNPVSVLFLPARPLPFRAPGRGREERELGLPRPD